MPSMASVLLAATLLIGGAAPSALASPNPNVWFYPQTGHSLTMGFARFVGDHGGTALTGMPLTEEISEHGVVVQYFQHMRLEWRPERATGDQVSVGALGIELGKMQPAAAVPAGKQGAMYFPATGHSVTDAFLTFYRTHEGAVLLGTPITEELTEGGAVVQYFSNAELQWRADTGVTLGDLGTVAAATRGWTPTAAPLAPVTAPSDAQRVAAGSPGPLPVPTVAARVSPLSASIIPASFLPGGRGHLVVPVLMYHHIGSWPSQYSVSTANFQAQLAWLQANGYQAVSLHQLLAGLYGPAPLPAKPVVISIDDGYPDAAGDARQVLLQHHMTATFFIPTVQSALTAATLRQMDSEGFDIEAHSRTHPDLTMLNDSAAWNEIAGSKQDLERILGHQVDIFAYPYGAVNARIVALMQRAGFHSGILAGGGRAYSTAYPFDEPRLLVDRGDDLANFAAKVNGQPYRDTLNIGGTPATRTGDGQPKPEYQPVPAPAPAGAATYPNSNYSSGTGSASTGDGIPPTSNGPASGPADASGSDPSTEPVGHGARFV